MIIKENIPAFRVRNSCIICGDCSTCRFSDNLNSADCSIPVEITEKFGTPNDWTDSVCNEIDEEFSI